MSTIVFESKMGGEWYDIRFRYEPDLVTLIKTVIPSSFRKWDPNTKVWSAMKTWAHTFAEAARHAGHTTVGIPTHPTSGSGPVPPPGSFGFASFYATQPPPFTGAAPTPPWAKGSSRPPPKPPPMPPKPPPLALTENWARELFRRVPPELREKLYKNLAKVLHEDLGGDGRLMQELNDARNGIAS